MTNGIKINWKLPATALRFLIIVLLIMGVFFRVVNLDKKVYWYDEAFTSIRISGYTEAEIVQQFADGREISVAALQKYQQPNPEKDLADTIHSLAVEDPQHSPLYYILARVWMQVFGNSVAVPRSLSVLFSLLVFPCLYWLCLELFKSPLTGWVAMALMAVSPFHLLFAQEARQYSLLTLSILLSSAVLLWSIRSNRRLIWVIYTATAILGLYSHILFVLVAIGHGIYVLLTERFRFTKILKSYLFTSLLSWLAFGPWLLIVINNSQRINTLVGKTGKNASLLVFLLKKWTLNITSVFLDLDFDKRFESKPKYLLMLSVLVLVVYSIYFLCRNAPRRVQLFVVLLSGITVLYLVLPDLIFKTYRSVTSRYLIPCYLGIQISVAYLLTKQVTAVYPKVWIQKLWQLSMLVLLCYGVVSCVLISQSETWWNKGFSYYNLQVAKIINTAPHPLVISDTNTGHILSLNHYLNEKIQWKIQPYCHTCHPSSSWMNKSNLLQIPSGFSNVFLFKPSELLKAEFEKDYKLKPAFAKGGLWQLEK